MGNLYSDELTQGLINIVLKHCNNLARVNYFRVYIFCLGKPVEIDINVLNNIIYKIGCGKYVYPSLNKDELLVAVCSNSGKEGMVFTRNGIYYKQSFEEASFTEYEKCNATASIEGLQDDKNYSQVALNEMFEGISNLFDAANSLEDFEVNLTMRIINRMGNEWFDSCADIVDRILDLICSFQNESYYERKNALPFYKFFEKREIDRKCREHRQNIWNMFEIHNKSGNIDRSTKQLIRKLIMKAISEKYFFDAEEGITLYTDPEKIKYKAMDCLYASKFDRETIEYTETEEFVAFIEVNSNEKNGLLFLNEKFMQISSGYGGTCYFTSVNCYCQVLPSYYKGYINYKKLNYVLHILHKHTEETMQRMIKEGLREDL